MSTLAIITPTRGRPDRFRDFVLAISGSAWTSVQLWVGLDDDDPTLEEYDRQLNALSAGTAPGVRILPLIRERQSLSAWTNRLAALALADADPPQFLASLGDDHIPRTFRWDEHLMQAIRDIGGSGIAYGNDLFQGRNLPTAWVVSADIVRSLGWMMLPQLQHMYVDNATLALGQALDRIVYRPEVIVEHVHWVAGKAELDESYRQSNSAERYAADEAAYRAWVDAGGPAEAAETVKAR